MTNEEKAREIANNNYLKWRDSTLAVGIQSGALEIAEWKDQQFGSIIAQVRKWLDEQGKLDQLDLAEFDMEIEKCWEGKK